MTVAKIGVAREKWIGQAESKTAYPDEKAISVIVDHIRKYIKVDQDYNIITRCYTSVAMYDLLFIESVRYLELKADNKRLKDELFAAVQEVKFLTGEDID